MVNKSDFDWAETYASLVNPNCKLFLQTEWDKKETNYPLVFDYILNNPNWKISVQIHKYLGVD